MAIDAAGIVDAARNWIGTPYLHQASLRGAGCDCLGLLRGVHRDLFGTEAEVPPPYTSDWAEAGKVEAMRDGFARMLREISANAIVPGDIALFRMRPGMPAKHCGIVAERDGGLSLIHARQNKRVSEEAFSRFWQRSLAFAFRL